MYFQKMDFNTFQAYWVEVENYYGMKENHSKYIYLFILKYFKIYPFFFNQTHTMFVLFKSTYGWLINLSFKYISLICFG